MKPVGWRFAKEALFVTASAALMCATPSAVGQLSTYHVGNSLTHDARPNWLGYWVPGHTAGWHIQEGANLNHIRDNPDSATIPLVEAYGNFSNALPNHQWDAVTLQPYTTHLHPHTILDEQNAILDMIELTRSNPANSETVFYINAPWPRRVNVTWTWELSYNDADDSPGVRNRAFYDALLKRVRANTDATVYLIPTGEAVWEISQRIASREITALYSIYQIFRDDLHLTRERDRYIAAATMFATLYGQSPDGLMLPEWPFDPAIPWNTPQPSQAYFDQINDAVWDTVIQYSGSIGPAPDLLGDLNGDGSLSNGDIAAFVLALTDPEGYAAAYADLNPDAIGDFSGNGTLDNADINGFVEALTGDESLPALSASEQQLRTLATIPEPTSLALLLGLGGLLLARRRRPAGQRFEYTSS